MALSHASSRKAFVCCCLSVIALSEFVKLKILRLRSIHQPDYLPVIPRQTSIFAHFVYLFPLLWQCGVNGFSHQFRSCSSVLYCTVLYYTILHCTVLYCTVLYCTVLYCTVLYCTVLYCTVLYCTVLYVRLRSST